MHYSAFWHKMCWWMKCVKQPSEMECCVIPSCSLESMIDVGFSQNITPQMYDCTRHSCLFSCKPTKKAYRAAELTMNAFLIWSQILQIWIRNTSVIKNIILTLYRIWKPHLSKKFAYTKFSVEFLVRSSPLHPSLPPPSSSHLHRIAPALTGFIYSGSDVLSRISQQ